MNAMRKDWAFICPYFLRDAAFCRPRETDVVRLRGIATAAEARRLLGRSTKINRLGPVGNRRLVTGETRKCMLQTR